MADGLMEQGVAPYRAVFPQAKTGLVELELPKKAGKARAGVYQVVENYCVVQDCDCRQVLIQVFSDKGRSTALIDFSLDIDNPFTGPVLNESVKQSAGAEDLLMVFVDVLNDNPDWYKGMCRRYRAVRKKIDRVAYQGEPFPKPQPIRFFEDDPSCEINELLADAEDLLFSGEKRQARPRSDPRQQDLFAEDFDESELPFIVELHDEYRLQGRTSDTEHQYRQQLMRSCLYSEKSAAEELAGLLIELFIIEDEKGLDAALQMLADALDILRTDLERQRPDAVEQMERWQLALAEHVFAGGVDFELGAEVTRVLLDSRVEILPQLHEANSRRMRDGLEFDNMADFPPEQALADLLANLDEMEINSAFELVDSLLQMLAVGAAEAQIALCSILFFADQPIARDAAVLLLFHPHAEVRAGVAEFLAQADGQAFTPESLRRLIVSRNWFPDPLRKNIDRAIANARRARIECASLSQDIKTRVYASAIDGADAQLIQIVLPQGKGFVSCSMMLKRGFGVADAFLLPFANKRTLNQFLKRIQQETGAVEMQADYPERRLCQALADGAAAGKVPNHWLVAIAERLGCDQWKAVPFDPQQELSGFREELTARGGKHLTAAVRRKALNSSAHWTEQPFAESWFEDNVEIDRNLEAVFGKEGRIEPMEPINILLDNILEPRRDLWVEKLVLTTGWLKKAPKPPVPWEQMFHLAEAVADKSLALKKIPLMIAIAEHSIGAFMGRKIEAEDIF